MTIVPLVELPEYVRNVRAAIKTSPALPRATVVALRGDLGAGKTTFVQTLARDMGIAEAVLSPTYVLMRSYDIDRARLDHNGMPRRFYRLVHIDAYRFEKPEQWQQLRPQEFLSDPATLVLIEWPEKVEGFMPKPDVVIDINPGQSDQERDIIMHA